MSDRIDHKDRPGEYRNAIFDAVQQELGFTGIGPTDGQSLVGDWVYRFHVPGAGTEGEPFAYKSFHSDGSAPARAVDGTWDSPRNRWKLNDDGSYSDLSYIDAMPEYGIEEPGHTEERYHILFDGADRFVLFNGDGSLIQVFDRLDA